MRVNRSLVLVVLASLTICFLGAAYTLWFNPAGLPLVGAGSNPTPNSAATIGFAQEEETVQLTVDESGVAAVTAAQLRSAGFSVEAFSADGLSLTYNGRPVPFLVRGEDDDAVLYFYAKAEEDPFMPRSVYRLANGVGQEMEVRQAAPFNEGSPNGKHALNWQEKSLFVPGNRPENAWMGPHLLAPHHWTLHLDAIQPDGGEAQLSMALYTNVETTGEEQHHIQVQINDRTVAEHLWQGAGAKELRIPLAPGVLRPDNSNSLTIIVDDDNAPVGDSVYVNAIDLAYDGPIDISEQSSTFIAEEPVLRINGAEEDVMVLDISDESAPVALSGLEIDNDTAEFAPGAQKPTLIALNPVSALKPVLETVPLWNNTLRDPQWGADYIAVVADVRGFEEALAPLLAHRQEQGMRVAAVPLKQIFDEFSYGHSDPQAIRDFIAYALENWTPPAPKYVLLVGDATYDVKNQVVGKNRNRLPTPMIYTENAGHVASDIWYVQDENRLPRAAIGRFPAQNAPQLSNMVNKTVEYERELADADTLWTKEALLIADDEHTFDDTTIQLAKYLDDSGYEVYRLHMSYENDIRHSIVSAMNYGLGLVSYVGRCSESAWGDEAVFQNSDAQELHNVRRLPIFSTFTCRNGSFADPRKDSLAESLLRTNNGGIVAAVAPAGEIDEIQHLPLTMLFHEQLAGGSAARLGDIVRAMYAAADELPVLREALIAVNLLGDPALQVTPPDE